MNRRSQWSALAWAMGLAGGGAALAYLLAGGRLAWAGVGTAIGAAAGALAPPAYDGLRRRGARHEDWRGAVERTPSQSPARLLDPRREVVGFLGREAELAALVAWCEDDDAERLRLVTGPGGVGKTRLAVELSQRMKQLGWRSERIGDGQEAVAIGALRATTRGRGLLVIDYSETRVGLKPLLTALTGEQGENIRVLLLARSAGDWLDRLGVGEAAVWDLIQSARQAELPLAAMVTDELSDAQVIALAVRSFASELGVAERTVQIYGDIDSRQRRVLDLHAAALVAVLAQPSTGPAQIDIRTVLGELLRHEQHFWYESARVCGLPDGHDGTTDRVLRQIVAAACLLGAATEDEAHLLPSRVPGGSPSAKITEWLVALYPPDPGPDWIGTLQPDRLAELHTMQELAASPELGQACLTSLDARQALQAVTLLARASADYPEAETKLKETLPRVADLIASMQAPADTLTAIFNAIPYPTVVLAPAAVALGRQIASHLPADADPAVRAHWLTNLGQRLSELGRPAEALPVTEEAVAIRRELAAANPDRYGHDLAESLGNLGVLLFEQGRPAQALPVTEEAVAIRRELAAANQDLHRPGLAMSLHYLGNRLSQLGRAAEALAVTEEAVTIRRELATTDPVGYRPDLALSLNNLGVLLFALGRPAQALPVTEEAVAIHRELAATNPDRYRYGLALLLNNLGIRFSQLGRPAEALPITEEVVAIRRELAAASPDRYRPDLAQSLSGLGVRFSELGRPAQGLPATEEAVTIFRELTAVNPDRYRPELARALSNLAIRFFELERLAEALPVTDEALTIRRELVTTNPDLYRPDLADSLSNLGILLQALGRADQALPVAEEAVAIRRDLAVAIPDRYRFEAAGSLDSLAVVLDALSRKPDADAAREEAAQLRAQPDQ